MARNVSNLTQIYRTAMSAFNRAIQLNLYAERGRGSGEILVTQ